MGEKLSAKRTDEGRVCRIARCRAVSKALPSSGLGRGLGHLLPKEKVFQQKRLDLFKTAFRQTPLTEAGLAAAAALIGGVQRLAGFPHIAAGGSGQRVGKALPAREIGRASCRERV